MWCCFAEIYILIHSLLKHYFWIIWFVFNLIKPGVALILLFKSWCFSCSGHLARLSKFSTSLYSFKNLILMIDWNKIINWNIQRIHWFWKNCSELLCCNYIFALFIKAGLFFVYDWTKIENKIFIFAWVWLKLVLVNLGYWVPFLSYWRK